MDNSAHYLFLASGVKNGEGFWIVGVKNCDENVLEDKTLLDCHRKELIIMFIDPMDLIVSNINSFLKSNKTIKFIFS